MINRLKSLTYFIIPFLVILWIVYINRFPGGYIYNSGDFSQPINLAKHFNELFYTWGDGISAPGEGGPFSWFAASPYYFVFYIIPKKFGLTDTQNLSFIMFGFLSLSYISFYLAQKLLFNVSKNLFTILFPLLYSINMTTLYFFTYTWGFSHHIFLYITFPVIFSAFSLMLRKFKLKYLLLYSIMLLISIPGFTNPAFFVALVFVLIAFVIGLISLKGLFLTKDLLFKILIIGLSSLGAISFWALPILSTIQSNMSSISGGIFNIKEWLNMQSADMLSILIGLPGYKGFPPFSHDSIIFYLPAFSTIFILFYLVSKITINQNNQEKIKFILSLLLVEIIIILLLKKSQPPFGEQTLWLFSIPFLNIFRSYEKLAIFIPFINLISIYGLLSTKNISMKILILMIILMIIGPFPFILGGIQTKYSITIGADKTKDYLSAKYSGLVKIPNDYIETAQFLNQADTSQTKIQSLPYSPLNTTAWVNFPKWKLIGFNITNYLFDKPVLVTNSSQFMLNGWIPQQDFNTTTLNPVWYIRLLSYFSASHIIYHLDVDNKFILESFPKIKQLEENNIIKTILSKEMLTLYEIQKDLVIPNVYIPQKVIITSSKVSHFPYLLIQNNYQNKSVYIFTTYSEANNYENLVNNIEYIDILDSVNKNEQPQFCSGKCFKIGKLKTGTHELQVSLEGLNKDELLMSTISIYELDPNNISEVKLLKSNALNDFRIDDYIHLGEFMVDETKSYYIGVDYSPIKDLLSPDTWKVLDENMEIVYKDINECTRNQNYATSGLSETSNTTEYIITEDIPNPEELNTPKQNIKQILFQGYRQSEFSPSIAIGSTCNIFTSKNNTKNFEDLKVYKAYNPKVIIKRSSNKTLTHVSPEITVEKINPTKYLVSVSKTSDQFILILNESYNKEWGIFKTKNGKQSEISNSSHFVSNGFSNGWIINPKEIKATEGYSLTIEYKPQKHYILGIIFSLGTITFIMLITLVKSIFLRRNDK